MKKLIVGMLSLFAVVAVSMAGDLTYWYCTINRPLGGGADTLYAEFMRDSENMESSILVNFAAGETAKNVLVKSNTTWSHAVVFDGRYDASFVRITRSSFVIAESEVFGAPVITPINDWDDKATLSVSVSIISLAEVSASGNVIVIRKDQSFRRVAAGSPVAQSSGAGPVQTVEVWPDRTALAQMRITQHSRGITWHYVLYDADRRPYRDKDGNIVVFSVNPDWRRSTEQYGEGQ